MPPHKITWLNYLNYYILRWFCIRLASARILGPAKDDYSFREADDTVRVIYSRCSKTRLLLPHAPETAKEVDDGTVRVDPRWQTR
jgi:hypothetical protein